MPCSKYLSECQKRKKKQKIDELIQSQAGDIDKFFRSKNQIESSGPSVIVEDVENQDCGDLPDNEVKELVDEEVIHDLNENSNGNRSDENRNDVNKESGPLDIHDPSNWDKVDQKFRDLLVEKGPPKRGEDVGFPKDGYNKHFFSAHYTRHLENGGKQNRKWLVYSNATDKIFCFYCKLFKEEENTTQLATEEFKDWRNASTRLKSHETSNDHSICMSKWIELETRLEKKETIDKSIQEYINKEKEHWRAVLLRILGVVQRILLVCLFIEEVASVKR
ncbi:uncharacterized protein LOC130767580 [Actinidia eriantha]|uniref:uncharacterized protein LOC130767580 n=1 Tax=Actinidia eriantha TaxID=165200 RepID=UPI002589460E|nr:uncharacterized protein LOC130767580 [Actinidia eriantha]